MTGGGLPCGDIAVQADRLSSAGASSLSILILAGAGSPSVYGGHV